MSYGGLVRRVTELEAANDSTAIIDIRIDLEKFEFILGEVHYKPGPTALKFHQCKSLVKGMMGPYGSGKTVAVAVAEAIFQTAKMPECKDGVRRYRKTLVRNTYPDLKNTTWRTWMSWLSELGCVNTNQQPPMTYTARFRDAHGLMELEAIFLSLDSETDIRKLKSLETTSIFFNEISEIQQFFLDHGMGRIGRYPSRKDLTSNYKSQVEFDTNPPDDDSWFYHLFEEAKDPAFSLFKQPPGLIKSDAGQWVDNPGAENMARNGFGLADDYYLNFAKGKTDEFIKVFIGGMYGSVQSGIPVYHEYNDNIHCNDKVAYIAELPIRLAFDFGSTPCVLISQKTMNGHWNILDEIVTKRSGLKQMIESQLKPLLLDKYSLENVAPISGDPAGNAGQDTDLASCFDIIKGCGFTVATFTGNSGKSNMGARTNSITARIESVKNDLNTLIDGVPKLRLHPNCKTLRKAFSGGYQMVRVTDGSSGYFKSEPKKNFFSHISDATQYESMSQQIVIDTSEQEARKTALDYAAKNYNKR